MRKYRRVYLDTLPSFNESKAETLRLFKKMSTAIRELGCPILAAFKELSARERAYVLLKLRREDFDAYGRKITINK